MVTNRVIPAKAGIQFLLGATLALAAALPAGAAVLYKSVSSSGVVEFSDTPPQGASKLVEQRELSRPAMNIESAGAPLVGGMMATANLVPDDDPMVAQASARLDQAEHELALARRNVSSPNDGVRLKGSARNGADEERIAYYQKNVLAARQSLLDVLRRRMMAMR